jgi:acyl-coenzyme A thioesterase PaaI-like protein
MGPSSILPVWEKLSHLPGGKLVFSKLLGQFVPYTGSIAANVKVIQSGYALVEMNDRRKVRNHLNSIHAIALVNLAEVTSGLALLTALPKGSRGILTGFSIRYIKKARGTIRAECRLENPLAAVTARLEQRLKVVLCDADTNVVAEAEATWTVGPELAGG